jgi:hypothetical protein
MRTLIFAGTLIGLMSAIMVSAPTVANAQTVGEYEKYCIDNHGALRCEWATMEQCKQNFVGDGGSGCYLNPLYGKQQKTK